MTLSRTSRRHTTAGSLSPAVEPDTAWEKAFQRPGKYRNTPTVVNGFRFASLKEARRYGELVLLERAGQIIDLRLQPRYPLKVNDILVGTYVGDFTYRDKDAWVTEDAKGMQTPVFKLKAKLFEALYGRKIVLT